MDNIIKALTKPEKLYSCEEIFSRNAPDINEKGIYAVYFKNMPAFVSTDNCVVIENKTLFYIGKSSSKVLLKRFETHYTKRARHSTLRMSLGVILYGQDSTPLRMMSKDDCDHFSLTDEYEEKLSSWMNENAFVCWAVHENPRNMEKQIIKEISPPFNIMDGKHPFRKELNQMRIDAKNQARKLAPLE